MTLLTPTLRQQMAATAARQASQPPPALSCSSASKTTHTPLTYTSSEPKTPPPTSISCTTSPCYCKPAFESPTWSGSTLTILIGHVDDIDDTPLRDWLPGCRWTGEWRRYVCGHHSTELTVEYADFDPALRRLTAAGWKQLAPQNTFYLVVDELQPERVIVMLRDMLRSTSLKAHMPWIDYNGVRVGYHSEFTCARYDLHRTLSGLHELGFGEQRVHVEGQELSWRHEKLQRCWSSAALLRGKDGKKKRTLVVRPRTGSVGEREDRPLVKRGRDGKAVMRTAVATASTSSSSTDSSTTTAAERPPVKTQAVGGVEEVEAASQRARVAQRGEDAKCAAEEEEEEDGWVVLEAAESYPSS